MNKYQNGKIYKLVGENDLWYIGSTIESLNKRLRKHNTKWDCMSRHLINPTIHLIEEYPCNNRNELRMREQYYINKYRDNCINDRCAYQSPEERKEYKKNYMKKWEEDNKEQRKEYMKKWEEKNKEQRKEYNKKYIKKNKEEIAQKAKEKVECECGCVVTRAKLKRHRQTKIHKNKMIENNINGSDTSTSTAIGFNEKSIVSTI